MLMQYLVIIYGRLPNLVKLKRKKERLWRVKNELQKQEQQENIPGTVVFLHQHAEEQPPGGAKPIVESGAIDHVDAVFGNHLWATTEFGKIETKEGAFMAGTDRFEITVQGKGGHGAYPHE